MTAGNEVRPIDQGRAARFLLGLLDGDQERTNMVLAEANADGAVHLVLAVLARNLLALSVAQAGGEDVVRRVLQRSILDAQLEGDVDG